MIMTYLLTVLLWIVMLLFVVLFTRNKIILNGWFDDFDDLEDSDSISALGEGFITLIAIAAAPILRVIVCATMIFMATITREQYEEKYRDEDDE